MSGWFQLLGPLAIIAVAAVAILAMQYGERKGRSQGQKDAEDEEQLRSLNEASVTQAQVTKAKSSNIRARAEGKTNAQIKEKNDARWNQ